MLFHLQVLRNCEEKIRRQKKKKVKKLNSLLKKKKKDYLLAKELNTVHRRAWEIVSFKVSFFNNSDNECVKKKFEYNQQKKKNYDKSELW